MTIITLKAKKIKLSQNFVVMTTNNLMFNMDIAKNKNNAELKNNSQ